MNAPLVSIVTLNWNSLSHTLEVLESLRGISYPNLEIIVVDNGSTNDEATLIEQKYPEALVIRNERNEGFCGGNNIGTRRSRGDYVLLLNNDTIVEPGFLEPMVEALESDSGAGIASPKILFYHSEGMIQYAGSTAINPLTVRGASIGYGEIDRGQHDMPRETALPHGAAMLMRRALLEKIGLLWETFFVYYEEYDFAERAKRHGYTTRFVPESVILHKESASIGKASPFKMYQMTRNRLLFLRRNTSGFRFLIGAGFYTLFALPKTLLKTLFAGDFVLTRAAVHGAVWHLTNLRLPGEDQLDTDQRSETEPAYASRAA
jgi:GT2 family glycosyltransferase